MWTRWAPQLCSAWAPTLTAGQHWPGLPQATLLGVDRVRPRGGLPDQACPPGAPEAVSDPTREAWRRGGGPRGPRPLCHHAGPENPAGAQRSHPAGRPTSLPPSARCPLPTCLSVHSRNPDKDERPWCYVVKDSALSWEYCRLAACGARGAAGVWGGRAGLQGPHAHSGHMVSLWPSPPHPHPWRPFFGGPRAHLGDGETEAVWSEAGPRPCSGLA